MEKQNNRRIKSEIEIIEKMNVKRKFDVTICFNL